MRIVAITVELTAAEALAFAQFLKRVSLIDYKPIAVDQQEASEMLRAGESIQAALRDAGYAPR
jgi:hypothetical protein